MSQQKDLAGKFHFIMSRLKFNISMGFRRIFLYRLRVVVYIALIWVFFSLLFKYNIVAVDSKLLLNRSISYFSLAFLMIGLIIAGAETFFLKKAFSRQ
ncbi:MAG TPA: hypothetical protein VGB56_03930, partial [Flavisolibacter sp.]